MKKIIYYISLIMMVFALASCQDASTYHDVSYYINYKLIAKKQVKAEENVTLSIDLIYLDDSDKTVRNYVASIMNKDDTFDYWYSDVSYDSKVTEAFPVTNKVSLYGRIVKFESDEPVIPEPEPTPTPQPSLTKLTTPIVSINEDGVATWTVISNAIRYKYQISGQNEKTTNDVSVRLKDGESIKVKAIGDGTKYSDSDYSTVITYYAPEPEPTPTPNPTIPGDIDGNGVLDKVYHEEEK